MEKSKIMVLIVIFAVTTSIANMFMSTSSPAAVFAQPNTATTTTPFPKLPRPSSPSISPSSILIVSHNENTYSIFSGFTKINNFVTTYTITGWINSIKSSSKLVTSTIIKDFDSNANIGYVRNNIISSQTNIKGQKQQLPNPFVDKTAINRAISNAVNNTISSASVSFEGYLQIKCTFGMNLANYRCNNNIPFGR